MPSLCRGWFLFSLNLDLELGVDGYVPVLLTKSQTRMELILALTSSIRVEIRNEEIVLLFWSVHTKKKKIKSRINDLRRKKSLNSFFCIMNLKCINCFYRAIPWRLGIFMEINKLQKLILPFHALTWCCLTSPSFVNVIMQAIFVSMARSLRAVINGEESVGTGQGG